MDTPQTSIQLIVFGERNRTDFPNVLEEVAEAGYPAIECGNLFQSVGEPEARRLLETNRLRVSGVHFGYSEYTDPAKVASHIAFCKAVGARHLMCSGVADTKTIDGYRTSCRLFNDVGRRLRDEGLVFNYHNHAWEFEDLGGTHGMEVIVSETDPALVKFNIDVFWVDFGGSDPAEFIRRHGDRAGYFHFKDGQKGPDGKPIFLELGRGRVDLKGAMAAAREVGAEWIVAEQDRTDLSHREAIRISRNYLTQELGL